MKTTKKTIISLVVLSVALFLPAIAQADWNPQDPAKWVQLPDMTPEGMDVDITLRDPDDGQDFPYIRVLADDFQCTQTGPITDIHIWGSWKNDIVPLPVEGTSIPGSENVMFLLGIHADIPVGPDNDYSMPGELLWGTFFEPGQFTSRIYHTLPEGEGEGWYDADEDIYTPNTDGSFMFSADYDATDLGNADSSALTPDGQGIGSAGYVFPITFTGSQGSDFFTVGSRRIGVSVPQLNPINNTSNDGAETFYVGMPEPTTLVLLSMAAGLAVFHRRRPTR